MTTVLVPSPQTGRRRAQRALVCASAVVTSEGRPATEHMVHDLSTRGARLCGLPHARIGDEVKVRFQLPRNSVCARGYILRIGSTAGSPDFAIELLDVSANAEDAIHDAVVEALSDPDRRSVLVFDAQQERYALSRGRFNPILPICATATTVLSAVQCLGDHPIKMGLMSATLEGLSVDHWASAFREIWWRTVDEAGRLHRIAAR